MDVARIARQPRRARSRHRRGRRPAFVGGDHTCTRRAARARSVHGPLRARSISTPTPTPGPAWGIDPHHGTVFRGNAVEEGLRAPDVIQIGLRRPLLHPRRPRLRPRPRLPLVSVEDAPRLDAVIEKTARCPPPGPIVVLMSTRSTRAWRTRNRHARARRDLLVAGARPRAGDHAPPGGGLRRDGGCRPASTSTGSPWCSRPTSSPRRWPPSPPAAPQRTRRRRRAETNAAPATRASPRPRVPFEPGALHLQASEPAIGVGSWPRVHGHRRRPAGRRQVDRGERASRVASGARVGARIHARVGVGERLTHFARDAAVAARAQYCALAGVEAAAAHAVLAGGAGDRGAVHRAAAAVGEALLARAAAAAGAARLADAVGAHLVAVAGDAGAGVDAAAPGGRRGRGHVTPSQATAGRRGGTEPAAQVTSRARGLWQAPDGVQTKPSRQPSSSWQRSTQTPRSQICRAGAEAVAPRRRRRRSCCRSRRSARRRAGGGDVVSDGVAALHHAVGADARAPATVQGAPPPVQVRLSTRTMRSLKSLSRCPR